MDKSARQVPQNRLLAYLTRADYLRLSEHLEEVPLTYRTSLYRANVPIDYVYFLEEGVASLVNTMRKGTSVEVGTAGNEGMVGLPIVFGDQQSPMNVYMQVPGYGFRMKASTLSAELNRNTRLRTALLHYAHAFFNQVAQSAACAHLHPLEQRCCRWLLMTHDRMRTDEFRLTHEFLAMMLGVQAGWCNSGAGSVAESGADLARSSPHRNLRPSWPRASFLRVLSSDEGRV